MPQADRSTGFLSAEDELTLMRLTLVFGATIYPAWTFAYRAWVPAAYDPLWERFAVGALCLAIFGASFAAKTLVRKLMPHWFAFAGWVVTAHIFYLMTKNQMNVSYVVGAFLVVFAVSASLPSRAHMLIYSVFTCVAALASATGDVPTPIFVSGIVTVSIIGAGLMAVRMALARRSQQRHAAKVALESELSFGRKVQQLAMPASLSGQVGGYAYRLVVRPHLHLSGDWSQVYVSPPGTPDPVTVIAIGDVVGKGASAALGTTVVASVWRTATNRWRGGSIDLPDLIRAMNEAMYGVFKGDQNSTLSLIEMRAGSVQLYTFGAPQWLVRHEDGSIAKVSTRGADPLGFQQAIVMPESLKLAPKPGDLFLAYTDGVIDSTLGRRDFIQKLKDITTPSPAQALEWIESKAIAHAKEQNLDDDFTMVAVLASAEAVTARAV